MVAIKIIVVIHTCINQLRHLTPPPGLNTINKHAHVWYISLHGPILSSERAQ